MSDAEPFQLDDVFRASCLAVLTASTSGSTRAAPPELKKLQDLALDDDEDPVSELDRLSAFYPNADYDFFGTPSSARSIYKSGEAWPVRTGPESQRIIREARGVHNHPMQTFWSATGGNSVCDILDDKGVIWTSVDCVIFADAGQTKFSPLLIWIGIEPKSLSYELANMVADTITYFLSQAGFSDFEIGFRESIVTLFSGPKLLSFNPLKDPALEFRESFATTLGLPIAPLKVSHSEGTGGLYLRESSDSDRVFLLTCAHVARPPPAFPSNKSPIHKKTSQPREHVVLLGSNGYANALKKIMASIAYQDRSIDDWNVELRYLEEFQVGEPAYITERRDEYLNLVKKAKVKIQELDSFHNMILKQWTVPEQRIIGEVIHVEPIAIRVPPHGYTRDWALIELYNDKFDWSTFTGNKIYIGGNLNSVEYGQIMFPRPEDRATYEYPRHGLLQARGIIQANEIHNPTQLDANREQCLLVVKHGPATGTTIGRVSGMVSFVRKYNEYGIKGRSTEIAVLPYGNAGGPFSALGDSGSIVLDRTGRILGMLTGGAGATDSTDVTYVTPYSFIDQDIKRSFPNSFLYEVVN
jgi:hypothetical protein